MSKFFVYLTFFPSLIFSFLFLEVRSAYAIIANTTNYSFVQDQKSVDSVSTVQCTGCSLAFTQCWNDATPGSTQCGTKQGCLNPDTGVPGGQPWSSYTFSNNNCRLTGTNNACTAFFVFDTVTYSTADKYDSNNPPVMDYGTCTGNVGAPYKTCCSGITPVGANHYPLDPYPPDEADCGGNTTVTCQQPSCISNTFCKDPGIQCGQAACSQLGPPPPITTTYTCNLNGQCVQITNGQVINGQYANDPTCGGTNCNSSCPNFAPPAPTQPVSCPAGTTCKATGTPQTVQTACTGSTCSTSCSLTCIDSQGHTCPATSCSTVWACQGSQWFNDGSYYYTCPANCPNCTVGQTQYQCGSQNTCRTP